MARIEGFREQYNFFRKLADASNSKYDVDPKILALHWTLESITKHVHEFGGGTPYRNQVIGMEVGRRKKILRKNWDFKRMSKDPFYERPIWPPTSDIMGSVVARKFGRQPQEETIK